MANQHVVRRGNEWGVLKEKSTRDTAVVDTQREAEKIARQIAINQGGDVIIHGRDGKIRDRNTYGKPDRFPPKG